MELIVTCWEDSLKPGDWRRGHAEVQAEDAEGPYQGGHSGGRQRGRWLAVGSKDGKIA